MRIAKRTQLLAAAAGVLRSSRFVCITFVVMPGQKGQVRAVRQVGVVGQVAQEMVMMVMTTIVLFTVVVKSGQEGRESVVAVVGQSAQQRQKRDVVMSHGTPPLRCTGMATRQAAPHFGGL